MAREAGLNSTVIVDSYEQSAETRLNAGNNYKGLVIHAMPGLHELAGRESVTHFPAGSAVLDLGAGSGAMSLRLSDLGFRVTASDYGRSHFQLHGSVDFVQANLNDEFSTFYGGQFDAVMALEIIEHLENPRHFARQCFGLLRPGGKLILSTPNIESPASIASFISTGHFLWFGETQYQIDGHITPLCAWQIEKSFVEAGFTIASKGSLADSINRLAGSPRLKLLARFVRLLSQSKAGLDGEIFIAIFQKPTDLPGDA